MWEWRPDSQLLTEGEFRRALAGTYRSLASARRRRGDQEGACRAQRSASMTGYSVGRLMRQKCKRARCHLAFLKRNAFQLYCSPACRGLSHFETAVMHWLPPGTARPPCGVYRLFRISGQCLPHASEFELEVTCALCQGTDRFRKRGPWAPEEAC